MIDPRFEVVATVDCAYPGRCSGQNDIARHERHRLTSEGNNLRDGINHLTGSRVLADHAILAQFDGQIAHIYICVHERTNRGVGVE